MSKLLKLFERARNNPRTVRFDELDKLLVRAEFARRQSRKGTSHYVYTKGEKRVTVPFDQPYVKEAYVKEALEAIGDYFEE